jgi:hypothetical protein
MVETSTTMMTSASIQAYSLAVVPASDVKRRRVMAGLLMSIVAPIPPRCGLRRLAGGMAFLINRAATAHYAML